MSKDAINRLLAATEKGFKSLHKKADVKFKTADDAEPLTGLLLDDPLLEFIFDRRFIPYGRAILSYGTKSSSKSTFSYHLIKHFQQNGGIAVLVDAENATDLDYVKDIGVDLENLIFQKPSSIEEALDLILTYVKNLPEVFPDGDTPVLIVLDSLAAGASEYEQQDKLSIGDSTKPGEYAKLAARFYRSLIENIKYEKCVFVGLNEERKQIGFSGFGGPAVALLGGEAQFFRSSYQFQMDKIGQIVAKDEYGVDRVIGSKHKMVCKRNKCGREGKSQVIEYDNYFKAGLDTWTTLLEKLEKEYPMVLRAVGRSYQWLIPNCTYVYQDGETTATAVIDHEKPYKQFDLIRMLKSSVDAKEHIRKIFGIRPLPPKEEVEKFEVEAKKQRGRPKKQKETEETDDF